MWLLFADPFESRDKSLNFKLLIIINFFFKG